MGEAKSFAPKLHFSKKEAIYLRFILQTKHGRLSAQLDHLHDREINNELSRKNLTKTAHNLSLALKKPGDIIPFSVSPILVVKMSLFRSTIMPICNFYNSSRLEWSVGWGFFEIVVNGFMQTTVELAIELKVGSLLWGMRRAAFLVTIRE